MIRFVLTICLAAGAFAARASPIAFFDVQLDVTAVAQADAAPAFDTRSSLPSAAPVTAAADSIGNDVAVAGAIAGAGLLSTSADVAAAAGIANAVATSRFTGSFLNAGQLVLNIDFTSLDLATGSGLAATSLFVSLSSGGTTLFEDFISGPWEFAYYLTPGTTGLLDLTLTSQSSAGFPATGTGNAFSSGFVAIAGTVPVPATWLLVLLALAAMAVTGRPVARRIPAMAGDRVG